AFAHLDWFVRSMAPTPDRKAPGHDCTLRSVPLLQPNIGRRRAASSLFPSECAVAWDALRPDVAGVHIPHLFSPVSLPVLPHGLRRVPSRFFPRRDMPSRRFVPAFANLLLLSFVTDQSPGASLVPSPGAGPF